MVEASVRDRPGVPGECRMSIGPGGLRVQDGIHMRATTGCMGRAQWHGCAAHTPDRHAVWKRKA